MNRQNRPSVAEIYQTDLERHLFAPAPHRGGPLPDWLALHVVAEWLRDRLLGAWARWKAVAESPRSSPFTPPAV